MIKLETMGEKDRELAMAFDQDVTQAMYDAVDTSNKLELNLQKFEEIVLTVLAVNTISWYQTIGGVDKKDLLSIVSHIFDGFDSDQAKQHEGRIVSHIYGFDSDQTIIKH